MVRVRSNWLREASGGGGLLVTVGTLSEDDSKSVQEAGISERVPSGNTSSR
jgi:hypothetical protein